MNSSIIALMYTAAGIAFIHTVAGPDHYIPFAALATARKWSRAKTLSVTILCGLGHVLSSVVLGLIGLAGGVAVKRLVRLEVFRGDIAAWLLTAFGLVYLIWGLVRALQNRTHGHRHEHPAGNGHAHLHDHHEGHLPVSPRQSLTPWALFIIFVFGPCEPLIPLLMYPAANEAWWGACLVALVFSVVTLLTMCAMVLVISFGIQLVHMQMISRFQHAIAGSAVFACGLAVLCGL